MMTAALHFKKDDHLTRSRADLAELVAALHPALEAVASGKSPKLPGRSPDSTLENLVGLFGLSEVDRQILLLAAGAEFDPSLADRIGALRDVGGAARADVTTALALLPVGGWEALSSGSRLRRWRLIDIVGNGPFLRREIVLDERVMQYLMSVNNLDVRLEGLMTSLDSGPALSKSQSMIAEKLKAAWNDPNIRKWPILLLAGHDLLSKRAIMQRAAFSLGLRLYRIDAGSIPDNWAERHALSVFCDRELMLSGSALIIESEDTSTTRAAKELADALIGPVALIAEDPETPTVRKQRLRLNLGRPSYQEKKELWHDSLHDFADDLGPQIEQLSERFSLDHAGMNSVARIAVMETEAGPEFLFDRLWSAAREQGRRSLGGLADRIEATATWDSLILPTDQVRQLRELTGHVAHAWKVYQNWGWEKKGGRGLGTAALFSGPSGTGKTLAAEVLANELKLDLFRIDLSQIVSKYIGETEKNLSRIFSAAEDGGAILLFDEADALFGKRSEVKDSHDRYANVEVSYLLQQMETYRGLTILTTNQKSALDQAFLRRLRFAINFPFPDITARSAIWAQIFPQGTPLDGFDLARLARMNVTGGSIRSIALNASFLAANEEALVGPSHILRAAHREYAKLEKPFTGSELADFL